MGKSLAGFVACVLFSCDSSCGFYRALMPCSSEWGFLAFLGRELLCGACRLGRTLALRKPGLRCETWGTRALLALFQDTADVSLSVCHGNDLQWTRFGAVDDGVIWISGQRPEAKGASGEAGSGVAAHRRVGNELAGLVDGFF